MSPEEEGHPLDVVAVASSDDDDGCGIDRNRKRSRTPAAGSVPAAVHMEGSSYSDRASVSRNFWRAGDFDFGSTKSAPPQGQLEHARVHPKFLHSNATSHKWAFGAIAELLDNAVDEIRNGATFVKVDKICNMRDNAPALLVQDNGGGMDPESLRQCMSLGYSKKSNTTIGQYGNGFKTSTMRLGADVIVFSRANRGSRATGSVGLLSYTFLRRNGLDDVIVPMVDFELNGNHAQPIMYGSQDDWSSNLKLILEWSPFTLEDELMRQFDDIGTHGTKVIVYNLWLNDDDTLELDFDNDKEDICLRDDRAKSRNPNALKHDRLIDAHISNRLRYSLRAYASILYLKKFRNFDIIIRGKRVEQSNIVDELQFPKVVIYRPQLGTILKEVFVETTLGFAKEAPSPCVSGLNVYHKNRLIRPFWKVVVESSSRGRGVVENIHDVTSPLKVGAWKVSQTGIGSLEANFIEPTHDKQDFERSAQFIRLEMRLKQMVLQYWTNHFHLLEVQNPVPDLYHMQELHADQPSSIYMDNVLQESFSAYNQGEMHFDQPVIGLAATLQQGLSNESALVGLPADTNTKLSNAQPIIGLSANASGRTSSTSVDKICVENIELFMRCEAYRESESNLQRMIEELERELEETKKQCSQLSSDLKYRRNTSRSDERLKAL